VIRGSSSATRTSGCVDIRASLLDKFLHRVGMTRAMRPPPCQTIVVMCACRAFTADIAEPLSAHYNARVPRAGDCAVAMLDMPVRRCATTAESGPGRDSP
jgi:hypothetical protein